MHRLTENLEKMSLLFITFISARSTFRRSVPLLQHQLVLAKEEESENNDIERNVSDESMNKFRKEEQEVIKTSKKRKVQTEYIEIYRWKC